MVRRTADPSASLGMTKRGGLFKERAVAGGKGVIEGKGVAG
jgi:hypothetical protein